MRRLTTKNSVYELDTDEMLVRRVAGANEPADGRDDGAWRPYTSVESHPGGGVVIFFPDDAPTITSRVVRWEWE